MTPSVSEPSAGGRTAVPTGEAVFARAPLMEFAPAWPLACFPLPAAEPACLGAVERVGDLLDEPARFPGPAVAAAEDSPVPAELPAVREPPPV